VLGLGIVGVQPQCNADPEVRAGRVEVNAGQRLANCERSRLGVEYHGSGRCDGDALES
jgi:hypothetical protein